ncbi:hypothetical protein ABZP36_027042 [Zizania latifolia]
MTVVYHPNDPDVEGGGGAVVCDGCNGLLLYRSPGMPEFHVVDPVTRRWVSLPTPAKEARLSMLAFDPSSSLHYRVRVVDFTGWRDRGASVETPDCVVRMDVADDFACSVLELPEPMYGGDGRVAHSGGRLYYVSSDDGELLKVWFLLDNQSASRHQWHLKHAVKTEDFVTGGCRPGDVRFLALHPEKDVVYMYGHHGRLPSTI